jgi:hypothetical protein
MVTRAILVGLLGLSLSGCGLVDRLRGRAEAPPPEAPLDAMATEIAAPVATTPLDTPGQTVAELDTTTEAERAAALAAPATGGELGRVVVALGSPAETGLWVQTALVTTVTQGRITGPGGQSLAVELRPGTGAALMSLAAYQALGIGLTELPEITVFAG